MNLSVALMAVLVVVTVTSSEEVTVLAALVVITLTAVRWTCRTPEKPDPTLEEAAEEVASLEATPAFGQPVDRAKVVWLLNKGDNTGMGQGGCGWAAGAIHRKEECVQQQSPNVLMLMGWVVGHDFERHECSLCAAFGMNINVYAKRGGQEHAGRNNMIATFLSAEADSLLAVHGTVVGKAVVMRFDQRGRPVDFPLQEFAAVTSFINDIIACADPACVDPPKHAVLMRTARAVFPYYKFGDTFRHGGFKGTNRSCLVVNGTLRRQPPDMAVRPTFPC